MEKLLEKKALLLELLEQCDVAIKELKSAKPETKQKKEAK